MKTIEFALSKAPATADMIAAEKARLAGWLRRFNLVKTVFFHVFILTGEVLLFFWHTAGLSFRDSAIVAGILLSMYVVAIVVNHFVCELEGGFLFAAALAFFLGLCWRGAWFVLGSVAEPYMHFEVFVSATVLFLGVSVFFSLFDTDCEFCIEQNAYISEPQYHSYCSQVVEACRAFPACDEYRMAVVSTGRALTVQEARMLTAEAARFHQENERKERELKNEVACIALGCKESLVEQVRYPVAKARGL